MPLRCQELAWVTNLTLASQFCQQILAGCANLTEHVTSTTGISRQKAECIAQHLALMINNDCSSAAGVTGHSSGTCTEMHCVLCCRDGCIEPPQNSAGQLFLPPIGCCLLWKISGLHAQLSTMSTKTFYHLNSLQLSWRRACVLQV